MSQPTNFGMQSGPPAPPTAVAIRLNESLDALLTSNSGSTAPSYAQAGTCWIDTSGTPWEWKIYDGTSWLVIGEVNASTHTLTLSTDVSIEIGDVDGLTAALAGKADAAITVTGAGLATGGGSLAANRTITVTVASQVQAEAGTDNTTAMTPLRVAQAINALVLAASDSVAGIQRNASVAEMEAWSSTTRTVTPGRQHHHPTHPKVAGRISSAGVLSGINISSSSNSSTGIYVVNFAVTFSGANYHTTGMSTTGDDASHVVCVSSLNGGQATTSVAVRNRFLTNTPSAGLTNTTFGLHITGDL